MKTDPDPDWTALLEDAERIEYAEIREEGRKVDIIRHAITARMSRLRDRCAKRRRKMKVKAKT